MLSIGLSQIFEVKIQVGTEPKYEAQFSIYNLDTACSLGLAEWVLAMPVEKNGTTWSSLKTVLFYT